MGYTNIGVSGYQLAAVNGMTDPDPCGFGFAVRYCDDKLSFVLHLHGHSWRITVPVSIVHEELDRVLSEQGVDVPAEVGESASCNGLFSRVKRALKRHPIRTLARHAMLGPAALALGDPDVDEYPEVGRRHRKGLFRKLAKHALLGPAALVVGDDSEFVEVGRRSRHRGGLFGAIKRVGSRVLRTVKKVVQSKALGGLVAASAMVMPAIGGPALAALTTAKTAMKLADAAQRHKNPIAAVKAGLVKHNLRALQQSSNPAARLALAAFKTPVRG